MHTLDKAQPINTSLQPQPRHHQGIITHPNQWKPLMTPDPPHPITYAHNHTHNTLLVGLLLHTLHNIPGNDCAPADMLFAGILTIDIYNGANRARTQFIKDIKNATPHPPLTNTTMISARKMTPLPYSFPQLHHLQNP